MQSMMFLRYYWHSNSDTCYHDMYVRQPLAALLLVQSGHVTRIMPPDWPQGSRSCEARIKGEPDIFKGCTANLVKQTQTLGP